MIDGLIKLMDSGDEVIGPINLGNTRESTVLELAEMVIMLSKSKSKITHKSLPKDDPLRRNPVIERAKELLGWEPKVKLEEGLKKTIDYFRQVI